MSSEEDLRQQDDRIEDLASCKRQESGLAYLTASITGLAIVGSIAVVALELKSHDPGNIQPIVLLLGFLAPTIAALIGVLKSYQNGADIKELHATTDGKMSQLMEQTAKASELAGHAAGLLEGKSKQ